MAVADGGKMIYICAQIICLLNFCVFCGSRATREYFNPQIFRQRRCITVKMYAERTRTMPHCSIVAFASVCRPKYNRHLVAHQLIIQLSWCEASNDVDSFLLYGQAGRSAEVEMVVSSIVAVVWLARPSQYALGGVVGKGRSSGDSD